ncbi:MAG: hypothetical protein ACLFPW_10810 [Spirochaetaceae bacterium]
MRIPSLRSRFAVSPGATLGTVAGALLLLFILLAPEAASGQEVTEATVSQSVVLPSRFYVGDLVEIRATVRIPSGVRIRSPETLPTPSWGELLRVQVQGEGTERVVRMSVRPFQPGTLTIPTLELGEVRLSGLSIYVDSVGEERELTLQQPRSQALLPGSQLLVTIVATALLLLPTVTVLAWRGGRRRISRLLGVYRENRPYRRARRRLKSLRQEMPALDGRSFYIEATKLLREYMAQRIDSALLSSTTRELPERFRSMKLPAELSDELISVYRYADMVKFARQKTSLDRRNEDLERIAQAVDDLHHWKEANRVGV